jgi:very-short-patch-repair endonuclease
MSAASLRNPTRNCEGDRVQRGGGGSKPLQRPEVYAARRLRREMSLPEVLLWQQLRRRHGELKFRRQHRFDPYVVDFYCCEERFGIEIDGSAHDNEMRVKRDEGRDKRLREHGIGVLRVPATEILKDVNAVVQWIIERAGSPLHRAAHGPPPRSGEDF